jgi:hypothetical protein
MTNNESTVKRSPIFPYLTQEQEDESNSKFLEYFDGEFIKRFNAILDIDQKIQKYDWSMK